MPKHSVGYTIGFSAVVCIVCSLAVSLTSVGLKERQQANALLDKQKNVLLAAGLLEEGEPISRTGIEERFASVKPLVVDLKNGKPLTDVDPLTFNQERAVKDPSQSKTAPENRAGLSRVPNAALIYQVFEDEKITMLVLPVSGKGLWSTLYGFLAVDADTTTVKGITFYQHGETPGLGGEIDNPNWKALWPGRKAFDESWQPVIAVKKGPAGPVEKDPHQVDGLSGATLTSRGVTYLLDFWLGEHGFGPFLREFRKSSGE